MCYDLVMRMSAILFLLAWCSVSGANDCVESDKQKMFSAGYFENELQEICWNRPRLFKSELNKMEAKALDGLVQLMQKRKCEKVVAFIGRRDQSIIISRNCAVMGMGYGCPDGSEMNGAIGGDHIYLKTLQLCQAPFLARQPDATAEVKAAPNGKSPSPQ